MQGSFHIVQVGGGTGDDRLDVPGANGPRNGYTQVQLGAGNDVLKLGGGDGADILDGTGNFGWDHYFGDAGDDHIDTSDLSFDVVDCGVGNDAATPDGSDQSAQQLRAAQLAARTGGRRARRPR